ncbi:hypothetical protein HAX54_019198 [Datura stramonium]|uniref:Cytochrome P450 n=1 Tax=Datura stramonium TaxID=4076 RepID=A0ABS8UNR4_DATST|nr:hypothetical protein [Datura stramonium]
MDPEGNNYYVFIINSGRFSSGDRIPTIEDLRKLRYLRVINESLRLYPQPPVLIRRSIMKDVVGGYPIKRGGISFLFGTYIDATIIGKLTVKS